MDCIFCKIINGEIPSHKVYEDELVFAFKDINPEAPVHILIVPKQHIESVAAIDVSHHLLIGHIHSIAQKIAEEFGINMNISAQFTSYLSSIATNKCRHLLSELVNSGKYDDKIAAKNLLE